MAVIGFVSCLPENTDNIESCVNYILYLALQGMYVYPVYKASYGCSYGCRFNKICKLQVIGINYHVILNCVSSGPVKIRS